MRIRMRAAAPWPCEAALHTARLVRAFVLVPFLATLLVSASVQAGPAYPVRVGPTGRFLVDQNGVPFLITGESPQALIGNLSEADAELFFANRQGHGFNTVWINLLCDSYTGCRDDGRTFDGVAPFTVDGDLATPNEAYFARADRMLQLAARYGFLVILDPAETGGWLDVLRNNGVEKCREYGQFLGRRYAGVDNIVWMHGNDYQDHGPDNDQYTIAVALGIQDFDTRHLHTVELNFPVSGSLDDERWAPHIQLNASYTYAPTYEQVLSDYNRSNFLPTVMVEASYEFENDATGAETRLVLRRQEYWSILSGATGQLYGNAFTWPFLAGWKAQLDTPGAIQVGYLAALFQSRRWFDLVPDQGHAVVTSGVGGFGSIDYVTAARTPDGTLVMAYTPSARTLTVDMSRLSGPVRARWYDPAAGQFIDIAGSPLANQGSQSFTTPGSNADGPGNEDWVLVLEVSASFADVPAGQGFWQWIEALFHAGITGGCGTTPPLYCPDASVSRAQMAVFLLRSIHGAGYQPPPATGMMFTDVPASQSFAKWIEQLAREGITGGCSASPVQYCPDATVTRGQMALFLLRGKHGAGYQPPNATGMFADVPADHVFARWIEQLAREGVTGGCGTSPLRYCPDDPVSRGQMAAFLVRAFNLPL